MQANRIEFDTIEESKVLIPLLPDTGNSLDIPHQ